MKLHVKASIIGPLFSAATLGGSGSAGGGPDMAAALLVKAFGDESALEGVLRKTKSP